MDENGYIRADEEMQTSVTGVYVAGDIRVKSMRQVVTAAADQCDCSCTHIRKNVIKILDSYNFMNVDYLEVSF